MEGCDSPDFEETCSSAVLICAIVWNLSAGAFRRQCITTRARSGGIQLVQPAGGNLGATAGEAGDPVTRLARAKEMLTNGLISDSEYESLKARIIGGL